MAEIHPDWKEFLQLLLSKGVRFVLVGGHALAAHGHPRFTVDLDCFFATDEDNCRLLRLALLEFGFGDIGVDSLSSVPQVFMLGRIPFRIDLLNSIDGVQFEEVWKDAEDFELGGVQLKVISRRHLIANKLASGRTKDLADLEELT